MGYRVDIQQPAVKVTPDELFETWYSVTFPNGSSTTFYGQAQHVAEEEFKVRMRMAYVAGLNEGMA